MLVRCIVVIITKIYLVIVIFDTIPPTIHFVLFRVVLKQPLVILSGLMSVAGVGETLEPCGSGGPLSPWENLHSVWPLDLWVSNGPVGLSSPLRRRPSVGPEEPISEG